MESRVSSNCTCNIHKPSMPEKEVNHAIRKHNGKDCHKVTDLKFCKTYAQISIFSIPMFCDKENIDLSSKIYGVSFNGIS